MPIYQRKRSQVFVRFKGAKCLFGQKGPNVCQGKRDQVMSGQNKSSVCQCKRDKCLSGQKGPSVSQAKSDQVSVRVKGTNCLSDQKAPSVCLGKRDQVFVKAKWTKCLLEIKGAMLSLALQSQPLLAMTFLWAHVNSIKRSHGFSLCCRLFMFTYLLPIITQFMVNLANRMHP